MFIPTMNHEAGNGGEKAFKKGTDHHQGDEKSVLLAVRSA